VHESPVISDDGFLPYRSARRAHKPREYDEYDLLAINHVHGSIRTAERKSVLEKQNDVIEDGTNYMSSRGRLETPADPDFSNASK